MTDDILSEILGVLYITVVEPLLVDFLSLKELFDAVGRTWDIAPT